MAELKYPLKLKLDEEGHVVVVDGKPVYVDQDGQNEVSLDAGELQQKVKGLNHESAERRVKLDALQNQFDEEVKRWEGLDPEESKKALEAIKNISEKELIDAGKLDEVRKSLIDGHEKTMAQTRKEFQENLAKKEALLGTKENQIRNLLVRGAFDRSEYLRSKTVMPADLAYSHFGNNFEVKEIEGQLRAVGKFNGNEILSESNGELASTEEAIEYLIKNYQFRDSILKTDGAGGGMDKVASGTEKRQPTLAETLYPSMKV